MEKDKKKKYRFLSRLKLRLVKKNQPKQKIGYSGEIRQAFRFVSGTHSAQFRHPPNGVSDRWVEATISQGFCLVNA